MFRSILGFAILAVAAWLALEGAFGVMGTLIGLVVSVLLLAAAGYLMYLVLLVFSPSTAIKARDLIKGWPRTVV